MKRIALLAGVVLLVITSVVIFSQESKPTVPNQLSSAEAVNLLRAINTAETDLFFTKHSYAPLNTILHHRFLRTLQLQPTAIQSTSATIKNYELLLIDSPDGKHYIVGLVCPKPECQPALFSNEGGLIYTAEAMGCSKPQKRAHGMKGSAFPG